MFTCVLISDQIWKTIQQKLTIELTHYKTSTNTLYSIRISFEISVEEYTFNKKSGTY